MTRVFRFRSLDLFSAAAGGWTLGLARAGFVTIAACEIVAWRRILYAENNPDVRLYDDIRTLTATRLVSDLGFLPDVIVGSPPCQDISSANTKGRGIDGERSGLYLEAVRLVGECRPRWFAFENSANLRTRGADRLLAALDALGYACEPCVVAAADVGANHVRKRSWLIGYDPGQLVRTHRHADTQDRTAIGRLRFGSESNDGRSTAPTPADAAPADADGLGRHDGGRGRRSGIDISAADDPCDTAEIGCGSRRPGRHPQPVAGLGQPPRGHDADAGETPWRAHIERASAPDGAAGEWRESADRHPEPAPPSVRDVADADEARQPHGRLESGLRPPEIADDGCGDGWRDDGSGAGQMGGRPRAGGDAAEPWSDWNGGLARHLWLDDGLSAWVAGTRLALGGRRGTAAAGLIVEAFGDAVLPQIPEAIGRAILRVEIALDAVLDREPATPRKDRA